MIQVADFTERTLAEEQTARAATEVRELNREMRQISEQLVLNGLKQQTFADRNRGIAEALQYSLLWRQPEKVFPGLRAAVFYEPALDDALVGGDLFDAFLLPDRSVLLMVGDVTGKGLRAAARTVEVRFALRAFAQDSNDPAEIVARLNEFLCDYHHRDADAESALVVLSLVVVDPVSGTALAASAGAEPPLVLRASGATEEVAVQGLILGIDRDASYTTIGFSLGEGDTLLMSTDGITETRLGWDLFGPDRLLEAARSADNRGSLRDVGEAILDAARAHGGGRFRDDVCLLLIRREDTEPTKAP